MKEQQLDHVIASMDELLRKLQVLIDELTKVVEANKPKTKAMTK